MQKNYTLNFLFLIVFTVVTGITNAQITINDSLISNEPTAISLQDLNVKVELANQKIKSLKKKIKPHPSVEEIKKNLPEYQKFITEQKKAYYNFKKSHPNKQKVINIINKWGSYNAYLDTWQTTINRYLDKNIVWIDELKKQEKKWGLTYKYLVDIGAKYEVRKNAGSVKRDINSIITAINKQNNEFLSLENKILLQKANINEVIGELEDWKLSEEFSVFNKRHPSVWKIEKENIQVKHENFNAWISFKENLLGIYAYFKSPENNILFHLLFLTLAGLWLWRLKQSYRSISFSDKDVKFTQSKTVIVNNLIPSILFVSLISSMVYFSHTPNLLAETMLVLAIITTLPLLNPITHKRFKGLILVIILLFILNTLKSYVWYSSAFYRIYLLFETLLVLVATIKMTYPYLTTRRLILNNLSKLLLRLSPLIYMAMGIGLIANIMGYTNLTDLMLKVVIKGAALLVMLYGNLVILGGLMTATVHFYFSKMENFDIKYKLLIEKRGQQLVVLFSYVFVIVYFLHVIDMYDFVINWFTDSMGEPIKIGVITFTIGSIISFLVVLFGSFAITSFISNVIEGGVLNFLNLPKGVPAIISVVVRYFLLAFAFVIAMSSIGINLSQFNLMAGALGLGIGFGLQNIISNFISGLILIFERPIQTNDVVEVGTLMGTVRKIGVRSSNVRTFDGAEVVVPNSNLISNEVINWTLSDNIKRIEIKIGTAYGSDLQQVVDILVDVATKHDKVLKDPPPAALFDQFGDSSLDFRLLYWVPVEYGIASKSEISIEVYNRFNQDGITIPFPQRDVNFSKDDIAAIKGVTDNKPNTNKNE